MVLQNVSYYTTLEVNSSVVNAYWHGEGAAGLSCTELSIWEFPSLRGAVGSGGIVCDIVWMGCPRRTPWTVLRTPVCCCLLSTSFTSVSIFSVCCNSSVSISVPGTYLCWKLPEQGPVPTSAGNHHNRSRDRPLLENHQNMGPVPTSAGKPPEHGPGTFLCWKTTRTWARDLPLLETSNTGGPGAPGSISPIPIQRWIG